MKQTTNTTTTPAPARAPQPVPSMAQGIKVPQRRSRPEGTTPSTAAAAWEAMTRADRTTTHTSEAAAEAATRHRIEAAAEASQTQRQRITEAAAEAVQHTTRPEAITTDHTTTPPRRHYYGCYWFDHDAAEAVHKIDEYRREAAAQRMSTSPRTSKAPKRRSKARIAEDAARAATEAAKEADAIRAAQEARAAEDAARAAEADAIRAAQLDRIVTAHPATVTRIDPAATTAARQAAAMAEAVTRYPEAVRMIDQRSSGGRDSRMTAYTPTPSAADMTPTALISTAATMAAAAAAAEAITDHIIGTATQPQRIHNALTAYGIRDNRTAATTRAAANAAAATVRNAAYQADQTAAAEAVRTHATGTAAGAAVYTAAITIARAVAHNAYDPQRTRAAERTTQDGRTSNSGMTDRIGGTLRDISRAAAAISRTATAQEAAAEAATEAAAAEAIERQHRASAAAARRAYRSDSTPATARAKRRAEARATAAGTAAREARATSARLAHDAAAIMADTLPDLDIIHEAAAAIMTYYTQQAGPEAVVIRTATRPRTTRRIDVIPTQPGQVIPARRAVYRDVAAALEAERRSHEDNGRQIYSLDELTEAAGDSIYYRALVADTTLDSTTARTEAAAAEIRDNLTGRASTVYRLRLRGATWQEAAEAIGLTTYKVGSMVNIRMALEAAAREAMPAAAKRYPAEARAEASSAPGAVKQLDKCGVIIATYGSIKEAARSTGIDRKNIQNAADGKRRTAGGYIWQRITEAAAEAE